MGSQSVIVTVAYSDTFPRPEGVTVTDRACTTMFAIRTHIDKTRLMVPLQYCPEYTNVPADTSRKFLKVFAQLLNKGKDEDGSDVAGGAGYSSGVATVILR